MTLVIPYQASAGEIQGGPENIGIGRRLLDIWYYFE